MERRHQLNFWYFIIALFGVLLVQQWWQQTQTVDVVPYSEFEQMLKDGKITEVVVGDQRITGKLKSPDGRKTVAVANLVPAKLDG